MQEQDELIEKYEAQMNNVKKKQYLTVIAMFIFFSLIMNIVFFTVRLDIVVEDDECNYDE